MKEADGNTGYTPEESGGRKGPKRQQKVIKDKLFDDAEEDDVMKNDESGGRKRPKRQRKVIKDKLCDDAEEDAVVENDETGGRKRSKRQRKVIQDKLYDDAEEDDVVENDGTGEKINRKRKRGVRKKKGLSKTPNALKNETKPEDIDWCSYILNSMKTCKNGWNRCNVKSKFTGAIILVNFEKDDGGFGSGELRDVYVSLNGDKSKAEDDSTETVAEVKDDDGKNRVHDLTIRYTFFYDELECILKHKIAIEKALCDAHIAFPEDDCVKSRITRYTSIFKEVVEIEKHVTQDS
ncbi:hypothetical protein L1987_70655 [Smallanthus sonchifolius]|uniref:Uncharacterized protein n=1 Tax=Smallanthus sonchifolius TaxID=185202 RepID=A0ACB9ARK8_9ASTR|nr:hypothetical protein L1987_70655 [Smallanthus sonchifolius]